MRYEAKTEQDAVEGAAEALGRRAEDLKYTVIRDEGLLGRARRRDRGGGWGSRGPSAELEPEP
jgi:hypothetical protein